MAWTAPMTAVAGSVFTAAQFNTFVRDNLNETGPAKATGTGSFIMTSGLNQLAQRTPATARSITDDSTTSTSFGDLAVTSGPDVTVTIGNRAFVAVTARINVTTASQPGLVGYEMSGANTVAADDNRALWHETNGTGEFNRSTYYTMHTGLNPGSTTFTMKYRVGGGTGNFNYREIFVIPF